MSLNRENHTTYDSGFATMLEDEQANKGAVEVSSALTEEGKLELRERYGVGYESFADALSDYVQEYDLQVSVPHAIFIKVAYALLKSYPGAYKNLSLAEKNSAFKELRQRLNAQHWPPPKIENKGTAKRRVKSSVRSALTREKEARLSPLRGAPKASALPEGRLAEQDAFAIVPVEVAYRRDPE